MKKKKGYKKYIFALALAVLFTAGAAHYFRIQSLLRDPARAFESSRPQAALAAPEPQKTHGAPSPAPHEAAPVPSPVLKPHVQSQSGVVNILVLGIDIDSERKRKHMGFRSDTLALCAIDLNSKACSIIGIPRDTRAIVSRLNKKGERVSRGYDRINAAYAFGKDNGKHSHENAMGAIEELLGVEVNYYASLDLDGIRPIADAVGGVPVTLANDYPGVGREGESVVLKGDAAMRYVRRRKGASGGGDLGRMKRQQEFLVSAARKIKQNGVKGIPELWIKCGSYVKTNLTLEQMLVLAEALGSIDLEKVNCVTLPGRSQTIEGKSYFIASEGGVRKVIGEVYGV